MKIKAEKIYFIKLGREGVWEHECIEENNTIKLGFNNPLHQECINNEWEKVKRYWITVGGKVPREASKTTNQIKYFYKSSSKTMWITFYQRKLYWCFAHSKVTILKDGTRTRKVKGIWSCQDINGEELLVENLRGSLTKVQGFQGTICNVAEGNYLINRINCIESNDVKAAKTNLIQLKSSLIPLVKSLSWKDFELLVDMIFSTGGWQRKSTLGKTEKDIDLILVSRVNNRKAFVQIKSKSNFNEFEKYINSFKSMKQYDEMYYVVHSIDEGLARYKSSKDINLITINKIVELIVNAGLTNWLINKVK